jgi:hypothetical protein
MPERRKHLMSAFCLAAILLVTYSIALIIAGHGVAPVALLLVWGDPDHWLPGRLLGWASIVGLVAVTILFRHDPLRHRSIQSTVRYTALAPDRFKNFWKD